MHKILISVLSALLLVVLALALVPLFVSTGFLKGQVQQFVKDQSGLTLEMNGDVRLSLLTGLKLSAETVSLRDAEDRQLFAIGQLDFGLALSPLLSGEADITGVTLNEPVLTLNPSSSNGADQNAAPQGANGAEAAPADTVSQEMADAGIDLSRLRLQRLTLENATIVQINEQGTASTLVSGLDLEIRVPDFSGPAIISGGLPYRDEQHSFEGSLANASDAINGRPTRLDLSITSDHVSAKVEGELALNGDPIFSANYAASTGDLPALLAWAGVSTSPLDVSDASVNGSAIVSMSEIRLPSLSLTLDNQSIDAAGRIFTDASRPRPLIRLALDTAALDLDALLAETGSAEAGSSVTDGDQSNAASEPDLSALGSFDATFDIRAGSLTYQGKSISQLKLIGELTAGQLTANLQSANIARGNIEGTLKGDLNQLLWNGSLKAHKLDIGEAAALAGQSVPLTGTVSSNLNVAAQGLSRDVIMQTGNIAGIISLEGGQFSHPALQDAIPGRDTGTLSNINSRLTIEGLGANASAEGSFQWNGEAINLSGSIGLAELIGGASIPTRLSLSSNPVTLSVSGMANLANFSLSGSRVEVQSPSSRGLLNWLGQPTSAGTPDLPIAMAARLSVAPNQANLSDLSLTFGQSNGSGALTYASGSRPSLSGQLAFNKLDVTPFMGDGSARGRTNNQAATTNNRASGPQGWDTSPIDLSGLNTLNADLDLSTQSLVARDIVTGPVRLKITLQDGALNANLDELSLYGGAGSGSIAVNAQSTPPQMTAGFNFAGMNMRSFLRDSIDMSRLDGTGSLSLNLTTAGASQADIIRALAGNGKLEISNGQIIGINIPQMLRGLRSNILEGWASAESQSTDFTALTASFTIDQGIVTNSDLLMLSPLLRLTGGGAINLPNKQIDYRATPKVIAKLEGQGGLVDAEGLPIPIIIRGSLTSPRIYPDIPGILENPEAIFRSLEQLGGTGKAASRGLQRLEKNVDKEIQKQSDRLGIDLNQLLGRQPRANQNTQQPDNQGQPQPQPQPNQPLDLTAPDQQPDQQQQQQQPSMEEQLLRNFTRGLFGN